MTATSSENVLDFVCDLNALVGVHQYPVDDKMLYMDLLLLADEQEDMIYRYLEKGTMYVLDDNGVIAECIVTDERNGIIEIKNIAVKPEYQGCGYGKALINFLIHRYTGKYSIMQVGTGDSALSIPFYEKCGFSNT